MFTKNKIEPYDRKPTERKPSKPENMSFKLYNK